jgi:hypothetical protein
MAKKKSQGEPQLRKSFLVWGGVILGIAVLGFVATKVIGGGGGEGLDTGPVLTPSTATTDGSTGGAAAGSAATKPTENKLTDGGRNPFSPKAAAGAGGTASTQAAPAPAPETTTAHSWQLLALDGDNATFLVDGKKHAGVDLKDPIVKDYTFNSVAGDGCVTVKKGSEAFALCQGAPPFSA